MKPVFLAVLAACWSLCAQILHFSLGPAKIQALIITGQWTRIPGASLTSYLKQISRQTGRFEVRVTEGFAGGDA